MSYAIFHPEKGKSTGGGLGFHIDRTEGHEHTYSHADPSRKHLNKDYTPVKWKDKPLSECINERVKEGYKGKKEVRKDAVKYITMTFTSDKEAMKGIFSDKDKINKWLKANYNFACREFGQENIVRFSLHMDESTPHLHCVVVPLLSDGRLSAKIVMGNIQNLQARQDRYAEEMKPLGLERGLKGGKAKHDGIVEYQGRVEKGLKDIEIKSISLPRTDHSFIKIETPPLLGRENWTENQNKAIREHQNDLIDKITTEHKNFFSAHLNQLQNKYLALQEKYFKLKSNKDLNLNKRESNLYKISQNLKEKYPEFKIDNRKKNGPKI
jgi:hypothetical protein